MTPYLTTPRTPRTKSSAYRHVEGMGQLEAVLQGLPAAVREHILLRAVDKTARPLVKWQKRYARRSERTGALRDSITYKLKKYGEKAVAVAIVGPSRAYYLKGGMKDGKLNVTGYSRPANYAHLIEFGHHAVAPVKGASVRKGSARVVSWVPAKPFVRPAAFSAQAEMVAAFDKAATEAIEEATYSLNTGAR